MAEPLFARPILLLMASEMQLPTSAQSGSVDVRAPGLFISLVKIISSCKTVRDYLMNPEIEKARGKAGTYPKETSSEPARRNPPLRRLVPRAKSSRL